MATSATASSVTAPGFQRMKATLGPTKAEALRQNVLDDRAKSMAASKTTKAKKAKDQKKPAKADARTITVLAKTNPHAADSRRAGWFKQLKTGMTVERLRQQKSSGFRCCNWHLDRNCHRISQIHSDDPQ